ncbi:MAG: UDP-N-acetylmuramoyl-L-alanyl-D-glutamate--2,6-diaminopimelate ligase [Anaerolineae bacterium]|nr:UDP-N-acetylmuramoyl-L-alanyl-D-glutamate--2,6-diaminopimelate ligase [Anaerolineae bacterium]
MILRQLLSNVVVRALSGDASVEITGLTPDSRQVAPGNAFVAYVGENVDGHAFIPQAVARGAAAIVGERARPDDLPAQVTYVQAPNGREALGHLAAAWYGHPSRRMTVIGVTGTEGKTTTVNLLQSIARAAGLKTGMISTVSALIGDRYQDTGLHVTTPDALPVQALLAEMAEAGTEVVILEATSHGLAHHRVTGVDFDVGVVTNITHSHLNFHGTWEQYCADKARLLRMLSTTARKPGVPKVSVINADDRSYPYLAPIPADVQLAYALEAEAQVTATGMRVADGIQAFSVRAPGAAFELRTSLVERYNVYNVLAAVAAALALDVPVAAIQEGVAALTGIAGRMERIDEGQDFAAIVDFAHSPNALEQALSALRAQLDARSDRAGRLIVVFGCAGLRDVAQRDMMGEIAGRLADVTVITAEDPRTEDLDAIIDRIAQGCERGGAREQACEGHSYYRVSDRGEAIAHAVGLARAGDIVVAAGKGHEQSMCFGTVEYPWDDRVAMRAALQRLLGKPAPIAAPVLPTARP